MSCGFQLDIKESIWGRRTHILSRQAWNIRNLFGVIGSQSSQRMLATTPLQKRQDRKVPSLLLFGSSHEWEQEREREREKARGPFYVQGLLHCSSIVNIGAMFIGGGQGDPRVLQCIFFLMQAICYPPTNVGKVFWVKNSSGQPHSKS